MSKEQIKELTEEQLQELHEAEEDFSLILKCKPTYNFQSIEFEWEVTNPEEDLKQLAVVYKSLLDMLIALAPEQAGTKLVSSTSKGEPATEKQLEILKKFKIPHEDGISKKEANKLISASMSKK